MKQMSIRSQTSITSNRSRCASIASLQSAGSQASSSEPISVAHYQSIASLITNTNLSASYTSDAPFYKEGVIVGKHLLERADQKAKNREWKEYFCIVHRAELQIHRLEHRGVDRKAVVKDYNAGQSSLSAAETFISTQSGSVVVGAGDLMVSSGCLLSEAMGVEHDCTSERVLKFGNFPFSLLFPFLFVH
jgi:hypothetical protein